MKVSCNMELQQKFDDYKNGFSVGSLMTLAAFTSVSLDDKVADGFGDHVLFTFTRVRGVRICALSQLPQEAEVLVPPPSVYRIIAVAMFKGSLVVTLEYVDSPLTYLAHPLLPASALAASATGDGDAAHDPVLESLADALVGLKVGLKKACVTFAVALCQEGVLAIGDLGDIPEQDARDALQRAGMSKIQQNKVMQALEVAKLSVSLMTGTPSPHSISFPQVPPSPVFATVVFQDPPTPLSVIPAPTPPHFPPPIDPPTSLPLSKTHAPPPQSTAIPTAKTKLGILNAAEFGSLTLVREYLSADPEQVFVRDAAE
jgi:hypothetical protein